MVLRRARLELDAVPRAATSEGLGDGQIWACAHMGWDGWLVSDHKRSWTPGASHLEVTSHLQCCGKLRHSSGYQHAMQHV